MTDGLTAEKLAEIKNYEEQMFDYFSHYSTKLREWYANGGEQSEEYKIQCNKLNEEYHRYLKYAQRLRSMTVSGYDCCQQAAPEVVFHQALPDQIQDLTNTGADNSNPVYTASAAADYTRYYQNMINYFNNLLASVQQSDSNCAESSDDENLDGKEVKSLAHAGCDNYTSQLAKGTEMTVNDNSTVLDPCSDPNAVMKEYFDRYVEAGEWDWASWNNYLSWIARTNPQWYEIFVNLSRGLGIDWNDMYEKWAYSVSGDSSCQKPPFALHYSNTTSASLNHCQVRNTSSHISSEEDASEDNENDWTYCSTCDQNFGTERAFTLHLRGIMHTQRILQSSEMYEADFAVPEENWETKHHKWLKSQYLNNGHSVVGFSGSFFCELCEVEFPSHKSLGSHLNGRRHQENVSIYESTGDRSLLKGKRKAPVKVSAKIQPLLDVCTQPLIGLNYLIEYQVQELDECLYMCSLCNRWLPRKSVIGHLCSVVHRKTYLNTYYLPLFRITDRDYSDRSLQACRLEVYARKIEDFEGRKRLIIKQHSVTDLDLQSEIIHLIQEHSEARLLKEKKLSRSPHSVGDQSVCDTSVSADLEEGEIREDSSDEETAVSEEAVGSPDSNSSFYTRYNVILKSIDKKRNNDTNDDTKKLNIKSQFVMNVMASKNKVERLDGESTDETTITDDDCEKYIMDLEEKGLLRLKAKRSNCKVRKDSVYTDQFTKEVDWVLEKLKISKCKHEENIRQTAADVSAAARIKAAKLPNPENFTVHQHVFIHNSSFYHYYDKSRSENNVMLPSLTAPLGPVAPVCMNYNYPPPNNTDNSNESKKIAGETNDRIALSSSAFNVILSAIDALKSSGQLPNGVNLTLKQSNKSPQKNITSNQPTVVRRNHQFNLSLHSQISEEPKQTMHCMPVSISSTSAVMTTPYPNPPANNVSAPTNYESVHCRSRSPQDVRGCTENQQVPTPSLSRHMLNNVSFKSLVNTQDPSNEMHQQALNCTRDDEKMFDAYSIFSKLSERKEAQKQSWIKTPRYFKRGGMRNEGDHGSTPTSQFNSGRRLSAIADFLGVNEPPTERKRIASSNQLDNGLITTQPHLVYSSSNVPAYPTTHNIQVPCQNTPSFPYNIMNIRGPSPSVVARDSYPTSIYHPRTGYGSTWPIHANANFSASNLSRTLELINHNSFFRQ
ncbi:unnamed protein product [Trichobilharzia szidati]|nr:unnamed protein product [Trichobilharzia szidati]